MNHNAFNRTLLLLGIVSLLITGTAASAPPATDPEEEVVSAEAALKELVILWRDGRYSELYEYGTLQSQKRLSREDFERRMQEVPKGLQCCWATLREVEGIYDSPGKVYVSARIGYQIREALHPRRGESLRIPSGHSFEHETFYLILQSGRWRVNLYRILEKSGE